jgi:hypothetical protein
MYSIFSPLNDADAGRNADRKPKKFGRSRQIESSQNSMWTSPIKKQKKCAFFLHLLDSRDSSRQPAPSPSLCYSLTHAHRSIGYRNRNPQPLADSPPRLMYLRVYDNRENSRQPTPSPSLYYSLTHTHRSIGYRNRNPQPLADSSARLMYLRIYDSRVSSHQAAHSVSLCYSFTDAHRTFPTPTLITISCTQVLWCLERLTRPTVSCCETTRTRLTICLPTQPSVRDFLDPPVSAFSLSLYRHPFLYTLFSSRFTLIINNNKANGVRYTSVKTSLGVQHTSFVDLYRTSGGSNTSSCLDSGKKHSSQSVLRVVVFFFFDTQKKVSDTPL